MKKINYFFKVLLINFLLIILLIELLSLVGTKLSLLKINNTPEIYLSRDEMPLYKWKTEEKLWGAWHRNNAKTRHIGGCFSVVYESNEVGARDDSFIENNYSSEDTFILLGDSFGEGFAVNREFTVEKLLEKNNINVLNFATSENFGPLQYYIVYKELASKYKHDNVLILFLPNNDFTDNDYEFFVNSKQNLFDGVKERFRPYINMENFDDYFYPVGAKKRGSFSHFNPNNKPGLREFIRAFTYTNNLLVTLNFYFKSFNMRHMENVDNSDNFKSQSDLKFNKKNVVKHGQTADEISKNYSGYYDATLVQQKAAIHYLNKIINYEFNKKNIFIISIPELSTIERYKKGDHSYTKQYWYEQLNKFDVQNEKISFIDLLQLYDLNDNYYEYFLDCNGHWSPKGHKIATEIISQKIFKN